MNQPPPSYRPPAPPRRSGLHPLLIAGLGILGVLVLLVMLALIGWAIGPDDDERAAPATTATSSTAAAPHSTTTPATLPSATTPPSVAAPPPTAPSPVALDPRCAPAADVLVALVEAGLTTDGYRLTNAQQITHNSTVFLGATTVDAAGAIKQRSDVWIIRDGVVYASTGGARNGSMFPRASSAIDIGPDDERVQAVDSCAAALSRGR